MRTKPSLTGRPSDCSRMPTGTFVLRADVGADSARAVEAFLRCAGAAAGLAEGAAPGPTAYGEAAGSGACSLPAAGAEGSAAGVPVVAVPVALACLLPLVPAWPYDFEPARTPAYFTGGAVDRVPEGSLALTYPVPRFPTSAPMLWQAQAGYRYRSVGGYVIVPEPDGSGTFRGGVTAWERVVAAAPSGRLGPVAPQVRTALREEMQRLDVESVLVADRPGADAVVRVVTDVLGRGPDETTGGVRAWYGLRSGAPRG